MELVESDILLDKQDELLTGAPPHLPVRKMCVLLFAASQPSKGKRCFFDAGLSFEDVEVDCAENELVRSKVDKFDMQIYTDVRHPHLMAGRALSQHKVAMPLMTTDMFLLWTLHLMHCQAAFGRVVWRQVFDPARMLLRVAHAARALNAEGIAHCDIRLSNIFVNISADGVVDEESVRLADYDLATQHQTTVCAEGINPTVMFAPELVRKRPISAKSDVYMLGGVLMSLLVCELVEPDALDTVSLNSSPWTQESAVWGGYETMYELMRFAKYCTSNDPEERPSLDEFCTTVEGLVAGFGRVY